MVGQLLHVGFGNVLAVDRVLAIVSPNSAPTKRLIQESKNSGKIIDMTNGRRTKAVLVMNTGHVALAAISPETIARRWAGRRGETGNSGSAVNGWPGNDE